MALSFDAISSLIWQSGTPQTQSHTITGSDTYLFITVGDDRDGIINDGAVSYNSVNCPRVAIIDNAGRPTLRVFGLVAPTTGANTISVVVDTDPKNIAFTTGQSYTGVHQTTSIGTFVTATGGNTPATVDVTSTTSGNLVVDFMTLDDFNADPVAGTGQTARHVQGADLGNLEMEHGVSDEAAGGTITMSWAVTTATPWATAAVELLIAAAADEVLDADNGSFALTGTDVALLYKPVIVADNGSFALTGQDVALLHKQVIVADTVAYSLTGTAVDLLYKEVVVAGNAAFALTGQDVALLHKQVLVADTVAYALTGTDVTTVKAAAAEILDADNAAYSLTGATVETLYSRVLVADTGSYSINGTAVDLLHKQVIVADNASYSLTGTDVDLVESEVIVADSVTYNLTGATVATLYNRVLVADNAGYALTGATVTLAKGTVLQAANGSFALTGQDVALLHKEVVVADNASYALTGQTVALLHKQVIVADNASFLLSGTEVQTVYSEDAEELFADNASFLLTGTTVALLHKQVMIADSGAYNLTGATVVTTKGHSMAADNGSFSLSGQAVATLYNRVLVADNAAYSLAGQTVTTVKSGDEPAAVTKGGAAAVADQIRIQHRKMLRKQLHLQKKPVEFDILVKEDGKVELDGKSVPKDLVGAIPKLTLFKPKPVTQDAVTEEITLLIRVREIKVFNQRVLDFKVEMELRQLEEELLILLLADELD